MYVYVCVVMRGGSLDYDNTFTQQHIVRTIMKFRCTPIHLYPRDYHPQGVGDQCHKGAREGGGSEADHAFVEGVDDVIGVGEHADGILVNRPVQK